MSLPNHAQDSIRRYVQDRIPPGGFLTAVLENDFVGALLHADPTNRKLLHDYAMFINWEIPTDCWGSKEIVRNYLKEENATVVEVLQDPK